MWRRNFFHTIILNSVYKMHVLNEIKRYTDWETGPDYPRTLTIEDYDRITQRGTECFWGENLISISIEPSFRSSLI